jgi:hypothetical protein
MYIRTYLHMCPDDVAQWTSNPARAYICKVLGINIVMLLCIIDLMRVVCLLKKRNKALSKKIITVSLNVPKDDSEETYLRLVLAR